MLHADRLDAEIDQLHVLLALVMEAEGAVVDLVEFLPEMVDGGLAREVDRDIDLDLVALAEIADIGDPADGDLVLGDAFRLDVVDAGAGADVVGVDGLGAADLDLLHGQPAGEPHRVDPAADQGEDQQEREEVAPGEPPTTPLATGEATPAPPGRAVHDVDRPAAVRFLQDAARGLRGLAERLQDPALRARFLSTRRRHEILMRASELGVSSGPETPFIRT